MLSHTGHRAKWDASADGCTRGEGVACVLVKTLAQALGDQDPIECHHPRDGRQQAAPGRTMPSHTQRRRQAVLTL